MRGAERRFGGDVGMSRYGRYGGGELPGRRGGGECSLADSRRKGELPRRAETAGERGKEGERERGETAAAAAAAAILRQRPGEAGGGGSACRRRAEGGRERAARTRWRPRP